MSDVNKTLKQYNTSLPKTDPVDKDRNFGRPPITTGKNASTKMDGWRGNSDFGNIMNGTNGVDWNNKYTKWGINSNPGGGANKAASIFNGIAMGLGAATTGLSIFGGIKAITDSNKEVKINAKQEAAANYNPENKTTLMDVCNTADSYEKDGKIEQMTATRKSLNGQMDLSTKARDEASNVVTSATRSLGIYKEGFASAKADLQTFDTTKDQLASDLSNLKSVDTSTMDATQKSAHDAKIRKCEEDLNAYSDDKRSLIVKKMDQNQEGIITQEKLIADNTALVKKLDGDVKLANKSLNKLDQKIQNHKDYA